MACYVPAISHVENSTFIRELQPVNDVSKLNSSPQITGCGNERMVDIPVQRCHDREKIKQVKKLKELEMPSSDQLTIVFVSHLGMETPFD